MTTHTFNIGFNLNDENGVFKFRMPVAPAYLQKNYQQKCLWNLSKVVLADASTLADDNIILVRINAPSSQRFIHGSAATYANFQSETPAHVQWFTTPYDSGPRVEWVNMETPSSDQIGASMWGNTLEVSIYQVSNNGTFTLVDGADEVIQLELKCRAFNDQYEYERFN